MAPNEDARSLKLIDEVVRRSLAGITIERVDIEEAPGSDDKPNWRIDVVIDPRPADVSPSEMNRVALDLLDALERSGDERFPVVSVSDIDEAGPARRVAA